MTNEAAFDANLRRLMDAHVEQSVVFYKTFEERLVMYLNLARRMGISNDKIEASVSNEYQRINEELERRMGATEADRAPQVYH